MRRKKKTAEAEARGGAKAAEAGNEVEAGAKEKEAAEAAVAGAEAEAAEVAGGGSKGQRKSPEQRQRPPRSKPGA